MKDGDNFMDFKIAKICHEAVHSSVRVRSSGSLVDMDNFVEKKLLFVFQELTVFRNQKQNHLQNLVLSECSFILV